MTYRGNFSKNPIAPETGSLAYTQARLAQSSDLEVKANTGYSASLFFLGCPMRPTSSWVNERLSQYLIHPVKFTNIQPRNNIILKNNKRKNIKRKTKNLSILTPITISRRSRLRCVHISVKLGVFLSLTALQLSFGIASTNVRSNFPWAYKNSHRTFSMRSKVRTYNTKSF